MKRVLIDARKARDWGIGTYVRALLRGLAGRGTYELAALARAADAPLLPPEVRLVRCEAPHYSLAELVAVRRAIGRERPDLFHAPHYVVPLLPPRRTVVTVHDLMHLHRPEHAGRAKRAYARTMLRRAVRSAARLLVDSSATRDELADFAPASAPKIHVVAPALEPRFLAPVPAGERARVRAAHRLDGPFVLFLGNDKPHKNLEGLLAAFARVAEGPRLALAGGPEATRRSRAEAIARHGLAGRVDDLGFVPDGDVPPLLAEAALLVLPSFAEGFGLPAVEAQAVGTPAVCSEIAALREATGGAALYADPADPAAIAAAIDRLLTDAPLRAELAARGRARAALLTEARLAGEVAAVYEEVLAS